MATNHLAHLAVLLERNRRREADVPEHVVAADAVLLRRLGLAALRYEVRACNDSTYSEAKQQADRRALAGRINKLAERYLIVRSDFGHDPRGGYAVTITFAGLDKEIPL